MLPHTDTPRRDQGTAVWLVLACLCVLCGCHSTNRITAPVANAGTSESIAAAAASDAIPNPVPLPAQVAGSMTDGQQQRQIPSANGSIQIAVSVNDQTGTGEPRPLPAPNIVERIANPRSRGDLAANHRPTNRLPEPIVSAPSSPLLIPSKPKANGSSVVTLSNRSRMPGDPTPVSQHSWTSAEDAPPPADSVPPPAPPAGLEPVQIPWQGEAPADSINLTTRQGKISLVARDAPVQSVLNLLAEQQGLNLIADNEVAGNISVTLSNVPFEDALNSIVEITGCTWTQQRGIVTVTRVTADSKVLPNVQGRVLQVFPLNFVSATEVESTVKGLLSPIGQVFVSQSSSADKRRTQELVVVEDIPASLSRIEQYILQIDQPPRQVMIEAQILEVSLKDDTHSGVNWRYLNTIAGSNLVLATQGFANPLAVPGTLMSLDGDRLRVLVEALKTTNDTKTLASPNVIVANGQEARIQIGAKLGYFVTTTTQTSTLQNVNFLNAGVQLRVTPIISNDDRVLLNVRPEISTGSISPLGLPSTQTTEAETTVLLEDGGGMVIGGLIKEDSTDTQDKVPILGDTWLIGRLFQRRVTSRARSEIVIVLVPRIAPYRPDQQITQNIDVIRTNTPLFQNGLQPAPRPYEPQLPDAIYNPRRLKWNRLGSVFDHPKTDDPKPLRYYFPTESEEFFPVGNSGVTYARRIPLPSAEMEPVPVFEPPLMRDPTWMPPEPSP